MKHLLEKLKSEGGAIVTSDMCSEIEMAEARVTGRWWVDEDGIGYVLRYPEWLKKAMDAVKNQSEDGKVIDFLDRHLISMSHARATSSAIMDGTTIFGQIENIRRSEGGGSFMKLQGRSIRDAVKSIW
jgi:hypothetical protein